MKPGFLDLKEESLFFLFWEFKALLIIFCSSHSRVQKIGAEHCLKKENAKKIGATLVGSTILIVKASSPPFDVQ